MARSFSLKQPAALLYQGDSKPRNVLITGAAGNIGSYFAEYSHQKYKLRLMVQAQNHNIERLNQFGEVVICELADLARLKELCTGIDTVVHLAGDPSQDATWDSLLPNNIMGTYNAFVAAKAAGCRRVIFASSIHAVSGYPPEIQVQTDDPVNPGDLYGVTKCFGEALGRYMAEQEGLSVVALRIGAFQSLEDARQEQGLAMADCFVSRRDLAQLIERSIEVENLNFAIFHGLSDNSFKRLDISDARALVGYAPQDDLFKEQPRLSELNLRAKILTHNMSDGYQQSGIRDDLKRANGPDQA
jgi:dTDP-4-dehydrorhamnose reductase